MNARPATALACPRTERVRDSDCSLRSSRDDVGRDNTGGLVVRVTLAETYTRSGRQVDERCPVQGLCNVNSAEGPANGIGLEGATVRERRLGARLRGGRDTMRGRVW